MGGTGFVAYFLQGFESTGFRFDSSPRIDKMEPRNPKPSKNKMAPKSVQRLCFGVLRRLAAWQKGWLDIQGIRDGSMSPT